MKPFNVRIYGLLIHNHKILIIKEPFMGENIFKFPGGGLEFGEGTRECLQREFKEELDLQIEVKEHFYTQDFFLQSALDKNEQILMIYYKVRAPNADELKVIDPGIEKLLWVDFSELKEGHLSLPTDRLVVRMLLEELKE